MGADAEALTPAALRARLVDSAQRLLAADRRARAGGDSGAAPSGSGAGPGAASSASADRGAQGQAASTVVGAGAPPDGDALVPAEVRWGGSFAVAGHVDREATRAVVRRRYRLADGALASDSPVLVVDSRADDEARGGRSTGAADCAGPDARAFAEVAPRLHVGRPCDPTWVARLAAEVAAHRRWCVAHELPAVAPNSMNQYGLMLDDLGLAAAMDALREQVVAPLARRHFADLGGADLDHQHAFVAIYESGGDLDLSLHVDDSEVTLNLCLGEAFEGGVLALSGLRCGRHAQTAALPGEQHVQEHAPGRALIHAGWHRHEALPLRAGTRLALILWCRSSAWRAEPRRRQDCGPWCGAA